MWFLFYVDDTIPPEVSCPVDITQITELGTLGIFVSWDDATASDLSGIASLVSYPDKPAYIYTDAPATIVTYTATDNCENVASCNFSVEVVSGIKLIFIYQS